MLSAACKMLDSDWLKIWGNVNSVQDVFFYKLNSINLQKDAKITLNEKIKKI